MTPSKNPSIFFEITDRCNHSCTFCGKSWRTDFGHSLSYDDIDIILSYEKNAGKISGGEPGLEKQKCFYYFQHETAPKYLNTNLTLWTGHELSLLQSLNVYFIINAPSTDQKEYAAVTYSTRYDSFIKNLYNLDPDHTAISIVLNEINIDTVEKSFIQYLDIGFKNFLLTPMIPSHVSSFDYIHAIYIIDRLYRTYPKVTIRTLSKTLECMAPPSHLCHSGTDMLVVLSTGDVVPCAWNNNHILGNIRTDTYEQIKENGRQYRSSITGTVCQGFLENYQRYHHV